MAVGSHLYYDVLYRMVGSHYLNGSNAGIQDIKAGTSRLRWNLSASGVGEIGPSVNATSLSSGSQWIISNQYGGAATRYEAFNAILFADGGATAIGAYSTTVSVAPQAENAYSRLTIKFGSGTGVVWGTLANALAANFQVEPTAGSLVDILSATYYEVYSPGAGPATPFASGTGILTKTISGTVATLVTAVATSVFAGTLNTQRFTVFGSIAGVAGARPVLDFWRYDNALFSGAGGIETDDGWPTIEPGDNWQATLYVDVFSGTIGIIDPGEW